MNAPEAFSDIQCDDRKRDRLAAILLYMILSSFVAFIALILWGASGIVIGALAVLVTLTLMVDGRLDLACCFVVIAAAISPLLLVLGESALGSYPSNVSLAALAGMFVARGLIRGQARPVVIFIALVVVIAIAVLRAPSLVVGAYQARQVLVPISMIFCGFMLIQAQSTLRALYMTVLIIGAFNLSYMIVEYYAGPPLSPSGAYAFNTLSPVRTVSYGLGPQLAGNYFYFYGTAANEYLIRLGGILFNPPVTGMLTALGAVIGYWTIKARPLALVTTALAIAATVGTLSRAGVLLIIFGIGLPILAKRFGRYLSIGMLAGLMLVTVPILKRQDAGASHLEGLMASVPVAVHHPLGLGFGHIGNAVSVTSRSVPGESLLGVFIAGTGLVGIVVVVYVVYILLRATESTGWIAWLSLGAIVVEGFSESAGGLAGTAALWLFPGAAMALALRVRNRGLDFGAAKAPG